MSYFLALMLCLIIGDNRETKEHVDLIELNHFHDCLGRHVYDQVIFYEWAPDRSLYEVRAWCLVEERELMNRIPTKKYSNGTYEVKWQDRDQNLLRSITSDHYRESWTQVDPERANKKILEEIFRTALIKRHVKKEEKQTEEMQAQAEIEEIIEP